MRLDELTGVLSGARIEGNDGIEVTGLAYDSRKVREGDLFVAVRGFQTDGNLYVNDAVGKGAAAVLTDAEIPGCPVPVVHAHDVRRALAALSDRIYGSPQRELLITGVTGTNGKTTTSYMIQSIFNTVGMKCGVIGTIRHIIGNRAVTALNTTPEAPDIHAMLRQMADAKQAACVIEVSSHALQLSRVAGIEFRAAGFLNISRDHLDFHGDIDSYAHAKSLLFSELSGDATAVINGDDPCADYIRSVSRGSNTVLFGFDTNHDIYPEVKLMRPDRSVFTLHSPAGDMEVALLLPGRYNIANAMAAAGIALACGVPPQAIVEGLASLRGVRGRYEVVESGQPFTVIVDYAHTPDALERILASVKETATGRVISVFGAGGDRDPGKRPQMGAVSVALADYTIITSDNPRTENPQSIIDDILAGVGNDVEVSSYGVEPDRAKAIEQAIRMAGEGDTVVIAGKGHEDYQIVGTEKIHFDDAETARHALEKRQ